MADLSQALTPDEVRQAKLSPKLSPELSRAETREKAGKYAGCDKCDKYFLYRYSF
nr:MAG TPA: Monocytic leukemia zinc finger protein finger, acetyl transferase, DNA [Caudoviricetes sp.]